MSVTMREIDQLRHDADLATDDLRARRVDAATCPDCCQGVACWDQSDIEDAVKAKEGAEAAVVVALQQWWSQNCKEVQ